MNLTPYWPFRAAPSICAASWPSCRAGGSAETAGQTRAGHRVSAVRRAIEGGRIPAASYGLTVAGGQPDRNL